MNNIKNNQIANSDELVEYFPYEEISNHNDNSNNHNNHNNSEIDESPLCAHIVKRSSHIKDTHNTRLPGDTNILLSYNTPAFSPLTTPIDNISSQKNMN